MNTSNPTSETNGFFFDIFLWYKPLTYDIERLFGCYWFFLVFFYLFCTIPDHWQCIQLLIFQNSGRFHGNQLNFKFKKL